MNTQSAIIVKSLQKWLSLLLAFQTQLDILQSQKHAWCLPCATFVMHLPQKVPDLKHMEKDGSVFAGFSSSEMSQKSWMENTLVEMRYCFQSTFYQPKDPCLKRFIQGLPCLLALFMSVTSAFPYLICRKNLPFPPSIVCSPKLTAS